MIDVRNTLLKILRLELELLSEEMKKELRAQGHVLTGRLVQSFEVVTDQNAFEITAGVKMAFYGEWVNTGIKPINIPFQRGSGKKSSKYIDGLIDFFRRRGLSDKEARRAAFATATIHKREGYPTKASRRFSSTGRRTGALNIAIARRTASIEGVIDEQLGEAVLAELDTTFSEILNAV